MMRTSIRRLAVRTVVVLVAFSDSHAMALPAEKDKTAQPRASLSNDIYRPFLINNIFNYYANNGDGSYDPFSYSNEGFEFPKGTN
jgi:hypothetical protein